MSDDFEWGWHPRQHDRELDIDQLEQRARKASSGPWRAGTTASEHAVWAHEPAALGGERLLLRMNEHYPNVDDRVYLAAVAPEVVLELIARLRAKEKTSRAPLLVRTARVSYRGNDALNITRLSGKEGLFLAPSLKLLSPVLLARKAMNKARIASLATTREDARRRLADTTLAFLEGWETYVRGYLEEMRTSYRANGELWKGLLARETVTLCCYCTEPAYCHRTLLATRILPAFGARYAGEMEMK